MAKGTWYIDAKKVNALALDMGMSESKLLNKAGLSAVALKTAKEGRPSYAVTVFAIAKVLGVEPSEIVKGSVYDERMEGTTVSED